MDLKNYELKLKLMKSVGFRKMRKGNEFKEQNMIQIISVTQDELCQKSGSY